MLLAKLLERYSLRSENKVYLESLYTCDTAILKYRSADWSSGEVVNVPFLFLQLQPSKGVISLIGSYHALKIGLSDTAVMDMMISNLQQQRQVTEQLRREAAIKRISVSQAVQDIIKFITEHEQEDCLLVGFSSQKANPFREKNSCTMLWSFWTCEFCFI